MLYELIANSARVIEALQSDDSDEDIFSLISDRDDSRADRDPLGDPARFGTRLRDGFALLGME
jgi:hypothetical protein